MKSYTLIHQHQYGNSIFNFKTNRDITNAEDLTEADLELLGCDFEPEKDEYLELICGEQDCVILPD